MAKKKKRSGGGGGEDCGGQQPKAAEEGDDRPVEDHADDTKSTEDKQADKDKQDKGKKPPQLPVVTVVLKVDMHCDGCAKRIRASVRHYTGVEGVAMDLDKATMTVVGRVDAKKLRDRVARKTRKKVDIVTNNQNKPDDKSNKQQGGFQVHDYGKPDYYWLDRVYGKQDKGCGGGGGGGKQDKKEDKGSSAGAGGGGKDNKDDKGCGAGQDKDDKGSSGKEKQDDNNKGCGGGGGKAKGGKDNKKPPAVPVVGTVVLKVGAMGLHCDGCMKRVRTKLFKIKGVEQVAMDMAKNQVTVTGTMDIKALPGKLQKKMRRPVDVVQPNKDKEKQQQQQQQDGGKENKQEGCKDGKDAVTKALTAEVELWKTAFYDQQSLLNTQFMLSDENPNACSVM